MPRRALLALATIVASFLLAAAAHAATYTVGTTSDTSGPCTPGSGTCSLRQLVAYENALSPTPNPPDTIVVPAGFYFLTGGPLTIYRSVSISGAGPITTAIDQGSTAPARAFDIQACPPSAGACPPTTVPPTVVMSGLTIEGGSATFAPGGPADAGFGGNVRNQGTLTLSDDLITNGTANSGSGGGVSNEGGTLTVTHSLVYFNSSNNSSGGGDSGGIQNYGPNPVTGTAGTLTVDNSTLAYNTAALGGGIVSWNDASNRTTVTDSTIAQNDGGSRTDQTNAGGLLSGDGGTITVRNSIVAANTLGSGASASNCGKTAEAGSGHPLGVISSAGHNLETGTDCGFTATGDLQNTDPKFDSTGLTDHGGDTDTFALQATSPAVDAVPAGAPGCGGTDQRGIARPSGSGCDMGAYELYEPDEGQSFNEILGAACFESGTTPTIDWGDGSPASNAASGITDRNGQTQLSGTHTYAEEGTYSGQITYAFCDGGATQTVPFQVKVRDAPLTASAPAITATAGAPFSGQVLTFTDADPGGVVSDYTATIDWGDGSSSSSGTVSAGSGGGFVITGTHTYMIGGPFQATVTVTDAGGAATTATVTVNTPPTPATGSAKVLGSHSAMVSGAVDPNGLGTKAHFELALDPKYTGGEPIDYNTFTPDVTVGSDTSSHPVSATVTGLLPNAIYHVRLVATSSAGTARGSDRTFKTREDPPPPAPVLGKTVNVTPVTGIVFVKLPGAAAGDLSFTNAFSKGRGFIPLTEARQLPSGSQVDSRRGTLTLAAAAAQRHGKRQVATLGGAIFSFTQARHGLSKGLTTLALLEGDFPGAPSYAQCRKTAADGPSARAAKARPSVLQALRAKDNHGKFRTKGRYSSATVRGTEWTTEDRCDGTLTIVKRGTVDVFDTVRRKTIRLRAGHRYLAKAPRGPRRR
jgi:hypothetical protein